jgi:CDP-diacylglycerol--glycerol-3-phosphate 3-phosphatidyltransferase
LDAFIERHKNQREFIMGEQAAAPKTTFTDRMRVIMRGIVTPIVGFLNRIGVTPNIVTIMGLIGNIIAAGLIAMGYITYGGLVALLAGACDGLDGSLARLRNEVSPWGAFVDSVTDRYSELVLLLGLLIYYQTSGDGKMMILVYIAAAGAVLVSYVKARAETLGYTAKIGILSRMERYLVLIPCLIFNIPWLAVWIFAIFANITAFQRIYAVRSQAYEAIKSQSEPKS